MGTSPFGRPGSRTPPSLGSVRHVESERRRKMTEAPAVQTQTSSAALAARAFAASDYDFNSLFGGPGLLLERPDRRGVSIVMARTTELPDDAVDALLAWRLGQYLSLIHISEPTRRTPISYAVFCLKKKT